MHRGGGVGGGYGLGPPRGPFTCPISTTEDTAAYTRPLGCDLNSKFFSYIIEGLNNAHENWLACEKNKTKVPCPVITLDGNLGKEDWMIQINKINRKILEIANMKRKNIIKKETIV